eukprot:CAMPEP_0172655500 /NCGR_PEP_ID=MMETSP1074-20121228/703_1 /TAXON_ID=2916 /ORGANISM="Ceratium fusus, Strain PA161109" /LENGTH=103 /DNA_ID=CAMNT_0013470147 /DNA_START=87 /DNA_END=399 /DNA_ORIENTATION=+
MDCALGIMLGLGIGAYSAQHGLRDCLDGTFHLTKKSAISAKEKAGPHLAKAHEAAMPYVKQVSANVSQQISALQAKKYQQDFSAVKQTSVVRHAMTLEAAWEA